MALLLGEDGRGYELARKLEAYGVWRSWLGESSYSGFLRYLSSPPSWYSFFNDSNCDRSQLQLQLRVRALLYDKASISLFLRSPPTPSSKLNPIYLQLHGDDIYFSLEDESHDRAQNQESTVPSTSAQSKTQSRAAFGFSKLSEHSLDRASNVGSRYGDPEIENLLPQTWYDQYFEKYKTSRQQRLPSGGREPHKRTPEGMSTYLRLLEKHKRRRQIFKEDQYSGFSSSSWGNGSHIHPNVASDTNNAIEDETCFFPEIMFPSNCVPDSALPVINRQEGSQKVEFNSVLDNLPVLTSRSAATIERFGIRPDYLRMGMGRNRLRNGPEGNRRSLSQDQASQLAQKVTTRVLANVGIDGATEISMEVLSQFLCCHISKLGQILKVLTDSYRKQCSATELIKMFVQTLDHGNFGAFSDHLKDSTKISSPQTQQHVQGPQSQHQNTLLQVQQQVRPMQSQMHMLHPSQNLALQQQQQQWNKLQRRHPSAPRPAGMTSEKVRPMVEVKIENTSDMPMDGTLSAINRQPLQFRQHHMAMAMANHQAQSGHQFKQLASLQIPQLQSQSMFSGRTPPVKVEGFQELMGGEVASKHESEENKLTSPPK